MSRPDVPTRPSPDGRQASGRQWSSHAVGAVAAGGYLVLAGLIAFLVLYVHGGSGGAGSASGTVVGAEENGQNPFGGAGLGSTGPAPIYGETAGATTDPTTDTTSDQTTDTSSTDQAGAYQAVQGPAGLTTVVPQGWASTATGAVTDTTGTYQANDPADAGRFVRYGASAPPSTTLQSSLADTAATNVNIQTGYQQINLAPVDFHGDEAVDWEFEFSRAGQLRHVESRYWVQQGVEYFVYVSATADNWPATAPIFQHMVSAATP